MSDSPVEGKVYAATGGAFGGGVLSTLGLWGAGVLIWNAPADAASATEAIAAVPSPVAAALAVVLPAAGAFILGFITKHTPRPDVPLAQDGAANEVDGL